MFPTAAGISSFFEHEIAMLQLEGKIFDRLGTVIMDFFVEAPQWGQICCEGLVSR